MFGHDSGPSKVFRYGVVEVTSGLDGVLRQMRLRAQYRNRLVEIVRRRLEDERAALLEFDEGGELAAVLREIEGVRERLDGLRQAIRTRNQEERRDTAADGDEPDEIQQLRGKLRRLYEQERQIRTHLLGDPRFKARQHEIRAQANAAVRTARAEASCEGLYWGSYLTAEQAVLGARRPDLLRFRPFRGEGSVSVQIQGGLPVEDVFGRDTRFQIDPVPPEAWSSSTPRGERRRFSRTTARLRVGSDEERRPVWAEMRIVMHRPLPDGGRVKWVHLVARRVGPRTRWFLDVVVELSAAQAPRVRSGPVVGVDVGWRLVAAEDGTGALRVAYLAWEDGRAEEMRLQREILSALDQVDALRSQRDRNFNAARDRLAGWLDAHPDAPGWLREECAALRLWRSPSRLARVALLWRGRRFAGDEDAYGLVEAWRKQDKHLWSWEASLREKALARRLDLYRNLAARLAREAGAVILEDFDLRRMARERAPEEGSGPDRHRAQRLAALSALRAAVAQACAAAGVPVVRVPAAGTTVTCHVCGHRERFDAASHLFHRCPACGSLWDQDLNAARNILAAGLEELAGRAGATA